ncbi:MAG: M48 family metallopeptidase [Oscillospiraceae bacterium]
MKSNYNQFYQLSTPSGPLPIEIIRSNRRTLGLEVTRDGLVKARLPMRLPAREAILFIEEHRDWILRKRAEVQRRREENDRKRRQQGAQPWLSGQDTGTGNTGTQAAVPLLADLTSAQKAQIKQKFQEKTRKFAAQMGVTYGRITIRAQRTRWGSCSSKENLNFNYLLYYLPEELMDYVVIHELAHRKHMNHSSYFWREVERYCPDYRQRRARLRGVQIADLTGEAD